MLVADMIARKVAAHHRGNRRLLLQHVVEVRAHLAEATTDDGIALLRNGRGRLSETLILQQVAELGRGALERRETTLQGRATGRGRLATR